MQITRRTIETQKGPADWFTRDTAWHTSARPDRPVPEGVGLCLAMQQNDESGVPVTWGEHVTDEPYDGKE